jgi:hypothetical protein
MTQSTDVTAPLIGALTMFSRPAAELRSVDSVEGESLFDKETTRLSKARSAYNLGMDGL